MNKLHEIVLTGGPCAGKTTALAVLTERLSERGIRVLRVPEAATLVIPSGVEDIGLLASDAEWLYDFESALMWITINLGKQFRNLGWIMPQEHVVILRDRAEMDIRAYLGPDRFDALTSDLRLYLSDIRDRYTGVIHLRTAALGAEPFYSCANNTARRESLEEARELDDRTLQAWVGHPRLRIIDNSTDFEGKMARLVREVSHLIGIPVPLEVERKFLLASPPDVDTLFREGVVAVAIEQHYLSAPRGREIRVRKRTQEGQSTYYRTTKEGGPGASRMEREQIISPREYSTAVLQSVGKVLKDRFCFVYENQYFELDHILAPQNLWVLEVELTDEHDELTLPPWPSIDREVTDDVTYRNASLAGVGQ